ncbi:MAG: hypothetical protein M3Q61_03720 [Chloroflexota bacterium]|nr:hypothetical protein [Chloroflexota bacterium]
MTTVVHCAICSGHGITTLIPEIEATEIDHDRDRDGPRVRTMYACPECVAADATMTGEVASYNGRVWEPGPTGIMTTVDLLDVGDFVTIPTVGAQGMVTAITVEAGRRYVVTIQSEPEGPETAYAMRGHYIEIRRRP